MYLPGKEHKESGKESRVVGIEQGREKLEKVRLGSVVGAECIDFADHKGRNLLTHEFFMGGSGMDLRALMNAQFTVYMHMDDFTICLFRVGAGI